MKNWRQHGLVLLAFAIVGLLLRWWMPAPTPVLDRPLAPTTIAESEPERRSTLEKPVPEAPPPPVVAIEEATAAVSEAENTGWIRCDLSSLADLAPSAPVTGAFERAWVRDDVLVAAVRTASGRSPLHATLTDAQRENPFDAIQATVRNANHPVGAVSWTNATPGAQGDCTVLPLQGITIRGSIRPVPEFGKLEVRGCGAATLPDANGDFEAAWFASVPCAIVAIHRDGRAVGESPAVWIDSATDTDITLPTPTSLRSWREQRIDDRERWQARLDDLLQTDGALDRAYQAPGLSAEARKILERRIELRDTEIGQLEKQLERPLPEEGDEPEDVELIWNDQVPGTSPGDRVVPHLPPVGPE